MWVLSHTDIMVNEKVDVLAKESKHITRSNNNKYTYLPGHIKKKKNKRTFN